MEGDYIEMERYSFISPPISSWSHHLKIGKGVGLWCISSLCIINTLFIFVIVSVMMMKHRVDESKTAPRGGGVGQHCRLTAHAILVLWSELTHGASVRSTINSQIHLPVQRKTLHTCVIIFKMRSFTAIVARFNARKCNVGEHLSGL